MARHRLTDPIEALEARLLATVVAHVHRSLQVVEITADAADAVTVTCRHGTLQVQNHRQRLQVHYRCARLLELEITGGAGPNRIDLSAVTRRAFRNFYAAVVDGGDGDDTIIGSGFVDQLSGSQGNDLLVRSTGRYGYLSGGAGENTLVGANAGDCAIEIANVDFLLTNDRLVGLGTDHLMNIACVELRGGPSNNVIDASQFDGRATLGGGDGDDLLISGPGSSALEGGAGDDTLRGDSGDEVEVYGDGTFVLTDDALVGPLGNDRLEGPQRAYFNMGPDNDSIDASLFSGSVGMIGNNGDDTLIAGGSEARLEGRAGNDVIVGGPSTDCLRGEEGDDTLTGGGGADRFEPGPGANVITDTSEEDSIVDFC